MVLECNIKMPIFVNYDASHTVSFVVSTVAKNKISIMYKYLLFSDVYWWFLKKCLKSRIQMEDLTDT